MKHQSITPQLQTMIDSISSLVAISDGHGKFVIHQSLGLERPLVLGQEGAGWIDKDAP
jgi:hypothetical protein